MIKNCWSDIALTELFPSDLSVINCLVISYDYVEVAAVPSDQDIM